MSASPRLQSEDVSIVALGNFNAAIFHPMWFAHHNLIRLEEAESAEIQFAQPEATVFTADWLKVRVTPDKIVFATSDPSKQPPLRDVVLGTFTLLEHTPLRSFGFNADREFQYESPQARDEFAERFAPKQPWNATLPDAKTLSLATVGTSPERPDRIYRVEISPGKLTNGVTIQLNEHYQFEKNRDDAAGVQDRALAMIEKIKTEWDSFVSFSSTFAQRILSGTI